MDVSSLLRWSLGRGSELRREFSEQDISTLWQDLRSMGSARWGVWLREHRPHIASLAAAAPRELRAELEPLDRSFRLRILLGVLLCNLESSRFFEILEYVVFDQDAPPEALQSGAAEAYDLIRHDAPQPLWPFAGDSPFGGS
ncbi:hypothetical protein GSUB_16240 [Geoalkalibacter subterraneus]|uniref:Uncharacterized protein n=1 Tax=Geoalkalibacter subterraneus TaxID=483547 RepID=A0A0B5FK56_9BACT|nr:hypothetical protein GSUB_16240 [Geoalkalibacter subterraneus]